jgi:hypothetical protein
MMKQISRSIALLLVVAMRIAFAGDTILGESCDLAIVGDSDKENFLVFDNELRTALSRQDLVATAVLVKFPLHVNYVDGSRILLNNAEAVQTRFAEIFPPAVRTAVLNQKPETLFCNSTGIMYGNGEVWISVGREGEAHYRIGTVNLPAADDEMFTSKTSKLEFVCEAEKQRVVIDSDANGTVRYRAWDKPRPVTAEPNMEIALGSKDVEGTGPCAHSIWKFRTHKTEFTVSELGCTDGSEPERAKGELTVVVAGKWRGKWWCY